MLHTVYITSLAVFCTNPAVDNSIKDPAIDQVVVKTHVTYTCNYGYSHTGGDLVRTCNGNGQLTGNSPICSRKFLSSYSLGLVNIKVELSTFK